MIVLYNAILFFVTLIGGSIPLWSKEWTEQRMKYLLAFSAAFLISVTFLHLIPDSVGHLGALSGALLIVGFFLQQVLQKYTHGVEHGHRHLHTEQGTRARVWIIFAGLAIHAFAEGLPLGVSYSSAGALPSLFLAIALHKLPEAMLIISLVFYHNQNKREAWAVLLLFSLMTPLSSLLTYYFGLKFSIISELIHWLIPLIAGAFIHISSTIFYESGTKAHEMTAKKWAVVLLGIGFGLLSLLGGH